jgi:hypothetical protein
MTIDNQKHRLLDIDHQALEELQKHLRANGTFMQHEAKLPLRAHGRDHVQREAPARRPHHRGLPLRRPGRAGVVVRTDARLVAKVDRCPDALGFGADRRIGLRLPGPHQSRILLPGLVERLLRAETQGLHEPVNRRHRQFLVESTLDQVANQRQRPQPELELELLRVVISNRIRNPGKLFGAELARTARNRLGEQGVLSAVREVGQPPKNTALIDAERCRNTLHRLPLTHRFDSLLPHHLQGVMIQGAAVRRSFAFHEAYYRLDDTTCGKVSRLARCFYPAGSELHCARRST